jgi:hypothetical protein
MRAQEGAVDANLTGLAACGLLIVVYAWGRFNTPPSNRSSTRQALYWWSAAGYVLSALVLFAALSYLLPAGPWRKFFGLSKDLPAPLIATLALTTLLPSIPLLKRVDEWFLSIFLDWAEIPAEVKRRAAAMTPHSFMVSQEDVAELRETYSDDTYGDNLVRHLFERRGDGLELSRYRLTRVVKLYEGIRRLAGEPRYARFFAEAEAEFAELERRAADFLRRSATSLTIAERLRRHEEEAVYDELMQERRETFARDCRDIFIALARFLAHAVLRSETSEKAIVHRLRAAGFAAAEPMNLPRFPIDSLTVLALAALVYLVSVTLFFAHVRGLPAQAAGGLVVAAKVWLVRLAPVCATVWLMQRYPFFRRAFGDPPRFSAYAVNGFLASGMAAGICLLFYLGGADGNADLLSSAVRDRALILLSFPLCAAVALCCDDWAADTAPPAWLRVAEAAGCALAMGAATVLLYFENMLPYADTLSDWKLPVVLALPAVMALVIGGCVPHIYRSARRAASARRAEVSRLFAPAAPPAPTPDAASLGRREGGLAATDAQHQQGREQAGEAAGQEGQQVVAGQAAHRARAKRRKRTADLVPGEDPRDDHRGVAAAEHLVGERESGGAGGDPVETVKDREDRQADRVELGKRHHDQGQAAQPVVPEQQHARVEAVAHPAGQRGADQAEDAERGQDVGAGHLRDAAVGAIGDQMGIYQPVGG